MGVVGKGNTIEGGKQLCECMTLQSLKVYATYKALDGVSPTLQPSASNRERWSKACHPELRRFHVVGTL
jgi:hypothetical protein